MLGGTRGVYIVHVKRVEGGGSSVQHVVLVNVLARKIIDPYNIRSLSLCLDGIRACIGSKRYDGVEEFREMVQLDVGRKDKRRMQKKVTKQ